MKLFSIKCSPACISADDDCHETLKDSLTKENIQPAQPQPQSQAQSVYTPTTAMLLDRCLMLDADICVEPALLPISPMAQALDTVRGAAWIAA